MLLHQVFIFFVPSSDVLHRSQIHLGRESTPCISGYLCTLPPRYCIQTQFNFGAMGIELLDPLVTLLLTSALKPRQKRPFLVSTSFSCQRTEPWRQLGFFLVQRGMTSS